MLLQPGRLAAGTVYMPLSEGHTSVPSDGPSPDATPGVSVRISETTVVQDDNAPAVVYYFVTFTVEYAHSDRFLCSSLNLNSGAEYDLARDWLHFFELHNKLAMALGQHHLPTFPDQVCYPFYCEN